VSEAAASKDMDGVDERRAQLESRLERLVTRRDELLHAQQLKVTSSCALHPPPYPDWPSHLDRELVVRVADDTIEVTTTLLQAAGHSGDQQMVVLLQDKMLVVLELVSRLLTPQSSSRSAATAACHYLVVATFFVLIWIWLV